MSAPGTIEALRAIRERAMQLHREGRLAEALAARAERYSEMAQALDPTAETLLSQRLLIPAISASREAIAATRARYAAALEEALASSMRFEEPQGVLGVSAFFLAYHGENDRELQIKTARTFRKIIPSLDYTAEHCQGVLARDPKATVVFIRGQFNDFTEQLKARFARSMPAFASRIVFLPRLPFELYLGLLKLAHVVLDTVHFNGMNSSLECFAMGAPVVTLPPSCSMADTRRRCIARWGSWNARREARKSMPRSPCGWPTTTVSRAA
jgi:hypothetical protein